MTLAKEKKVSTADKDRMHFRLNPDIKARVWPGLQQSPARG
ncbi:MAG: hypothetical protein ABR555_07430 [Pyrinomonadaceae bacterium]